MERICVCPPYSLRSATRSLDDEGMRDAGRQFGISRKTVYRITNITITAKFNQKWQWPALRLNSCGRICMHRKKINISSVMAGQRLGIKEADDGIWLISFMQHDLGYIDLEQKTLQTIDNPFGARLLPMS